MSTSSWPTPTVSIRMQVAAGGVEHGGNVGGGAGQSAERAARGHAADEDSGIGVVVLHANAVAQNRAAGVGAGRVDGDDADGLIFFAIVLGELIDQRALPCSGRAGQTDDARVAGVREESLEQVGAAGLAILDDGDGAGQGARVAGAQVISDGDGGSQT